MNKLEEEKLEIKNENPFKFAKIIDINLKHFNIFLFFIV